MKLSRRETFRLLAPVLAGSSLLPPSLRAEETPVSSRGGGSRILVAWFSRSGNTRVIAGQIRRARNADLFEILPATPYPEDYQETVDQARKERDEGYEPPLKSKVTSIDSYDTIFLGFPIWGETAPPVIRSFLSSHELAGKTIHPFITHGGFGLGDSWEVLAKHAPRSRILKGFSLKADQEKQTLAEVTGWLGGVETGE